MLNYPYVDELVFSDEKSIWLVDNYYEGTFIEILIMNSRFINILENRKIISRTFRENCNAELLIEIIPNRPFLL